MAIISTVLLLLTTISIAACNSQSVDVSNYNSNDMFARVYTDNDFYVIYDNETKVMYAVSSGGGRFNGYNRGNLTMLVNADGTPKLYDGE